MPVVALCETPFYGYRGIVKRVTDVVFAAADPRLTAPLMLAIAIGVRRTSPGPIIFKQRRYGLDGREIVVYKFRTMTVLEDGAQVVQATRTIRASRRSEASCGATRSTSCRSCSTCCRDA